jgi:hypothetical protein
VVVVWQDFRDGNDEIYLKYSLDGGNSWSVDERLTNNTSESTWPAVALDEHGIVYVAWSDLKSGSSEIYFTKSAPLVTDIEEDLLPPTVARVEQNYPNPFNPTTTIRFALPKSGHVSLKIYDLLGREVATLVSDELEAGYFTTKWDPHVSSGVYIYRLRAGDFVQSRKLMLLR